MKRSLRCGLLDGFFLSVFLLVGGCQGMNVKGVTSKLRIGMNKVELDQVMKGEKFLKEQTVQLYRDSTEQQTRAVVWNEQRYEFVVPEDLITKRLTFDGSVNVYSYLIKETRRFANPVTIDYLAIFYSQKEGKVIGWAQMEAAGEVRIWGDKF